MGSRDAAKVGITVLIGLAVLAGITFLLPGAFAGKTKTVEISFPDAQGLQPGGYVRVRGVVVGTVKDVQLGEQAEAVVHFTMDENYTLKSTDKIRIAGGGIGFSPPYIEITPANELGPNATRGTVGTNVEGILGEGQKLIGSLNTLTERMNVLTESLASISADPKLRGSLTRTAQNFEKVSASSVTIARNMETTTAGANRLVNSFQSSAGQLNRTMGKADRLMDTFQQTAQQSRGLMSDTRAVMQDTRAVVQDTRGVVKDAGELVKNTNSVVGNSSGLVTETRAALAENRQKLATLFDNLNASLKTLDATLSDTRAVLNDEQLRGDLKATAENLRTATENLKKIGEDVRTITGDPKVQDDLKVTVSNLREVSEQTSEVLTRVQNVLGKTGGSARSIGEKLKDTSFRTDAIYGTRTERARFDINATLPWSNDSFFRIGMYDFGEANHFNAQYGHQLRKNIWGRAGFYASKLGFGLDIGDPNRTRLGLDVFGVDDPQVDVRANIPLFKNFDLTFGLDRLQSRPDPVIGLRYSR